VQLLLTIGLTVVLLIVARLTRNASRPGVTSERDSAVVD
jgi:AAT family amino acid transporter